MNWIISAWFWKLTFLRHKHPNEIRYATVKSLVWCFVETSTNLKPLSFCNICFITPTSCSILQLKRKYFLFLLHSYGIELTVVKKNLSNFAWLSFWTSMMSSIMGDLTCLNLYFPFAELWFHETYSVSLKIKKNYWNLW